MEHYFIDDKGIFCTKSSSYPDQVWNEYLVVFADDDVEERFVKFLERLRKEGSDKLAGDLCNLLGAKRWT